jgi:hypothetical protein
MHARIDQLLSVRDREPVDATVHSHLEQCVSCSAQLGELTRTTEQLRTLPQLEPPKLAWEQIAARLPGTSTPRSLWRSGSAVAAMAAGVVGVTIAVSQWRELQTPPIAATQVVSAAQRVRGEVGESRAQLIQRSRELEEVLQYLPQRPSVKRPGLAVTVDVIEQRVQWLDWRLSEPPDAELNDEQSRVLWSERVTLMDSLVKLRYAESEGLAF